MKALLQSALEVSLSIVRANPTVLEGLGAHLEGNCTCCILYLVIGGMFVLIAKKLIVNTCNFFNLIKWLVSMFRDKA